MRNRMKDVFELLKETLQEWSEDKAHRLAAGLAYYTLFSLAPLLIIVIAIAGLWFGEQAVRGEISGQIQGAVGPDAAKVIQDMITSAHKPTSGSILATAFGLATLLLGASGFFSQLQGALNTIWEVASKPGRGLITTIRHRFIAFMMVLGVGLLLLISGIVSAALTAAGASAGKYLGGSGLLFSISDVVLSFLVITVLFAMIFRVLPDVEIAWSDVWVGALFTSVLFVIGKFLISFVLAHSSTSSAYGAAGSLVMLLVWIYYSAQILLLGAEFTQVYARRYGKWIRPARDAISLSPAARAHQGIPKPEDVRKAQEAVDIPLLAAPETAPVEKMPADDAPAPYVEESVIQLQPPAPHVEESVFQLQPPAPATVAEAASARARAGGRVPRPLLLGAAAGLLGGLVMMMVRRGRT